MTKGSRPAPSYRLEVTATAARAWGERLPHSVATAVLEFLQGDLLRAPRRVGHELQRELAGTWSARRGTYRILYEILEEEGAVGSGTVRVLDVDHRGGVYRRR